MRHDARGAVDVTKKYVEMEEMSMESVSLPNEAVQTYSSFDCRHLCTASWTHRGSTEQLVLAQESDEA